MTDFFRARPQPDVPTRPRTFPRTTGLPSVPGPPAAVLLYDTLAVPAPLRHPDAGRRQIGRAHV